MIPTLASFLAALTLLVIQGGPFEGRDLITMRKPVQSAETVALEEILSERRKAHRGPSLNDTEQAAVKGISRLPIDEAVTLVAFIREWHVPSDWEGSPGSANYRNPLKDAAFQALEEHPQWREFFRTELTRCAAVKTPREALGDTKFRRYQLGERISDVCQKYSAAFGKRRDAMERFQELVGVMSVMKSPDAVANIAPHLFEPNEWEDYQLVRGNRAAIGRARAAGFRCASGEWHLWTGLADMARSALHDYGITPPEDSLEGYRKWWLREAANYGAVAPVWPPPSVGLNKGLGAEVKETAWDLALALDVTLQPTREKAVEILESDIGPGILVSLNVAVVFTGVWWVRRKRQGMSGCH